MLDTEETKNLYERAWTIVDRTQVPRDRELVAAGDEGGVFLRVRGWVPDSREDRDMTEEVRLLLGWCNDRLHVPCKGTREYDVKDARGRVYGRRKLICSCSCHTRNLPVA